MGTNQDTNFDYFNMMNKQTQNEMKLAIILTTRLKSIIEYTLFAISASYKM